MINVVKIGGNIIDNPEKLGSFLKDFATLEGPKVLIHGGGKEATRLSTAMGIETRMIDGRRVTDRDTLDVVTMVYAGLINKRIVSLLQSDGCNAIGLTGADANAIPATRRNPEPIDYGYVGDIDPQRINVAFVNSLLKDDIVPVFCAICHDSEGGLLNCNADSVGASVALALSQTDEVRLSYCFEMPGVMADINDPSSLIPFIRPEDFDSLLEEGIIAGGMIPKIRNAINSVERGVREVRICRADNLRSETGTIIHNPGPTADNDKNIEESISSIFHPECNQTEVLALSDESHPRLGQALELLSSLIATPSPSRHEEKTAVIWLDWLHKAGATEAGIFHNNVYAVGPGFDPSKPTLLLNSHHDTVRPSADWKSDPYKPDIADGKIRGLGSSDAGGSGVALAMTYLDLRNESLPFNLILAITAAEEVMGPDGMRAFLPFLESKGLRPAMAIVGEPTSLRPSIGERGLIVLDGETAGISGHAARKEGVNALYKALEDISILSGLSDDRPSDAMGPLNINVTMIEAGTQHNVVPDRCKFVVDVRTTDSRTNSETAQWLTSKVKHSTLTPRSTRVWPSLLPESHHLYRAAVSLGLTPYISPTTSDIALLHDIPALKIGPGDSTESHTAEEALPIDQLNKALYLYPDLLRQLADLLT